MNVPKGVDEGKFLAAVDLVRRTGAAQFQIRYQDDEDPVVWLAVAAYRNMVAVGATGRGRRVEVAHEAAAALDPVTAVLRLCDRLVDGAICTHCHRPSGVDDRFDLGQPLPGIVCWYVYDPELKTFRRGCEGDAP